MEEQATCKNVDQYLSSHRVMTLATVTQAGKPMAHTVEYASDGKTIYFATLKTTRKVQNIQINPAVALTIDEDYDNWLEIQGIQLEAKACILTDADEIGKAAEIYLGKFPFVANFPPNPDIVFIKVDPTNGYFLDYSKGFTHKDPIALNK